VGRRTTGVIPWPQRHTASPMVIRIIWCVSLYVCMGSEGVESPNVWPATLSLPHIPLIRGCFIAPGWPWQKSCHMRGLLRYERSNIWWQWDGYQTLNKCIMHMYCVLKLKPTELHLKAHKCITMIWDLSIGKYLYMWLAIYFNLTGFLVIGSYWIVCKLVSKTASVVAVLFSH